MEFHESVINPILKQVKSTPSENLESETIEFKGYRDAKALHNSKDLAEELSALANHKGGYIIIGVKDDSDVEHGRWEEQLAGFPMVDTLELKERLLGKLQPQVNLVVDTINFEGKSYLYLRIEKQVDSLVSTTSGKTCIRVGRSCKPMSPGELEQAVKSHTKYDWSGDTLVSVDLSSLDPDGLQAAIVDYCDKREIKSLISAERYLESVGATRNGEITRGGLLFLGKSTAIDNSLGDYEYRFSWKKANGDLVINDVWKANLWDSILRAKKHFEKCNTFQTFQTEKEEFTAPLMDGVSFHEAYINALVHRDYSVDGMISVTFTDESLRIHSPGEFYGGVTSENIVIHEPRHRNKNLAKILMTHNLVDRAGMGVLRMGLGSLRYGRKFPEFREQSDSVEVKMEAQYLRPAVAALGILNRDDWGIPELLIINSVYETGVVSVQELESMLKQLDESPWRSIVKAVDNMDQVELCGTSNGVFVRVVPNWKKFLEVGRIFRASSSSEKYVALYEYLKVHGEVSNADVMELLNHNFSSQTSAFLRKAKFVQKGGSSPTDKWRIVEQ